ncbi:alpha-amylase family protein [Paenibacillus sp. HB172176]|uniref:alpha-amylase family protein n=1 Tax=Paenibacillus sp. HB172176 TaxID=2493690 RepID=UPI00143B590B|nr:alpha-amylase family protein [Paenibacillus sp. HB172176]
MMQRTLIFYDSSFPISGRLEDRAATDFSRAGAVVGAEGLADALSCGEYACFVNVHAPYFPKSAWPEIIAYLRRGGGLISMGGAPFRIPVGGSAESGWTAEATQTAYHRELNIHEILEVDAAEVAVLEASADIPLLWEKEELFSISSTWNLVPHTTKSSDLPHQMGSAGPMDARLYPLLKGVSEDGREIAAPVVLWENLKGAFSGSRWLFVNQPLDERFYRHGGGEALRAWASYCAAGVTELWLKPNYASYEPGDSAMLTLQAQRLGRSGSESETRTTEWRFRIETRLEGKPDACWTHESVIAADSELRITRVGMPMKLEPGFYRVRCLAEASNGESRLLTQGFWCFDQALLSQGSPLTCGRDYFERDGRPMPVVGMTYMTSDVARKFLFLPNVSVWDKDMAQMRKAGINWIRTGIWTAYRNIMQVDGHASEEALRAIDAFILTAKRHDLQVTFTFFSFTPEAWEGRNPYLDPRSVEAQKRFVRSIVSRHRETMNVDWDLINEPSMFDPPRIFSEGPRSCGDEFERAAYAEWLRERHGSIARLQELWNMSPMRLPSFEAALPPEPEDINFDVQDMHQGKNGTRWLDYALFSMDMHNQWAKQLYDAIKDECPNQLVTVGQDEALGAQRPSPFFYGEAADYTTVHSWWLNDHLLWDGVFAKTADKPCLTQETGIMYVETPEGRAKRSETELRNILERKYAYAFATGGAGAMQWIWNTNYDMDNANESHIGALRADGTEKPEASVSYDFGRFMAEIADLFRGRALEDTAVLFPYSNDFSNRKLAFDATTRAARVLGFELKEPFRGIGEYQLEELKSHPPKLLIAPSPHNLDSGAFERLLEWVETSGSTLLFTGPMGLDAYWRPAKRLEERTGERRLLNVRREESLTLGDRELSVSYGHRRIAEVSKEAAVGTAATASGSKVEELAYGKGRIIWCPLPIELNERNEGIAELYRHALCAAGCAQEMIWLQGGDRPGVYGRKLEFAEGFLYVFLSESGKHEPVHVQDPVTGKQYSFMLESDRSVLFACGPDGSLRSVYRPKQVYIETTPAAARND